MNRALPFLFLTLTIHVACAQSSYRVIPGKVDTDGFPTTPASICLGPFGTDHCYTPPGNQPFGLEPKATTIGQLNGLDLILFAATFNAGGSGSATSFALLTIRNGDFVNLLPKLELSNQSDFAIWNLPEFSPQPMFVTADFVADPYNAQGSKNEQETHFGHHFYKITVLSFDSASGHFTERLSYTTLKPYSGLDSLDKINVVTPERKTILLKLRPKPRSK